MLELLWVSTSESRAGDPPHYAGSADCGISQVRQQVETIFSQLWRKFVDRVFSRS